MVSKLPMIWKQTVTGGGDEQEQEQRVALVRQVVTALAAAAAREGKPHPLPLLILATKQQGADDITENVGKSQSCMIYVSNARM